MCAIDERFTLKWNRNQCSMHRTGWPFTSDLPSIDFSSKYHMVACTLRFGATSLRGGAQVCQQKVVSETAHPVYRYMPFLLDELKATMCTACTPIQKCMFLLEKWTWLAFFSCVRSSTCYQVCVVMLIEIKNGYKQNTAYLVSRVCKSTGDSCWGIGVRMAPGGTILSI